EPHGGLTPRRSPTSAAASPEGFPACRTVQRSLECEYVQHIPAGRLTVSGKPLPARCVAEVIGTFILVFFGCGAVHAAVLTGAQSGLWQVAIVWGVAVTIAVYVVGGVSGAHINPAITVALAVWGHFSVSRVLPYVAAQLAGAALAGAALYGLYQPY